MFHHASHAAGIGRGRSTRCSCCSEEAQPCLTTVQIGISFISIVAGAFGGTTLANPVATWLSRAAAPLVWLVNFSSRSVLKLLRVKPLQRSAPSEEEFMLFLQQSRRAGIIKYEEQQLIKNVFGLDQRTAASVMTPRNEVRWLDLDDPPATWLETMAGSSHTRLMVVRGDLDDVLGVVSARELLLASQAGTLGPEKLIELALPAIVITESANALLLFEELSVAKTHIAVVVDEYGSVKGIVALHDLFEALLGQLFGAPDARLLQAQPDGSWLVSGYYRAAELQKKLHLTRLPGNGAGYETVSGMMATVLDRSPAIADTFE